MSEYARLPVEDKRRWWVRLLMRLLRLVGATIFVVLVAVSMWAGAYIIAGFHFGAP